MASVDQQVHSETLLDLKKSVYFETNGQTVMAALLQLSLKYALPMGIVVSNGELCHRLAATRYAATELSRVLDDILVASGYRWSIEGGVIQIRAKSGVSHQARSILDAKLPKFGNSMNWTLQGLGILLDTHIKRIVSPDKGGYAGSIFSSPDAEIIPDVVLENASVKKIANYLVAQGSKGIWILYSSKDAGEPAFRALGFKDDQTALVGVDCSLQAQ